MSWSELSPYEWIWRGEWRVEGRLGLRHFFGHGQKRDYLSRASLQQRARGATKKSWIVTCVCVCVCVCRWLYQTVSSNSPALLSASSWPMSQSASSSSDLAAMRCLPAATHLPQQQHVTSSTASVNLQRPATTSTAAAAGDKFDFVHDTPALLPIGNRCPLARLLTDIFTSRIGSICMCRFTFSLFVMTLSFDIRFNLPFGHATSDREWNGVLTDWLTDFIEHSCSLKAE